MGATASIPELPPLHHHHHPTYFPTTINMALPVFHRHKSHGLDDEDDEEEDHEESQDPAFMVSDHRYTLGAFPLVLIMVLSLFTLAFSVESRDERVRRRG